MRAKSRIRASRQQQESNPIRARRLAHQWAAVHLEREHLPSNVDDATMRAIERIIDDHRRKLGML